jgi:hypothetical protein
MTPSSDEIDAHRPLPASEPGGAGRRVLPGFGPTLGITLAYLGVLVLIPPLGLVPTCFTAASIRDGSTSTTWRSTCGQAFELRHHEPKSISRNDFHQNSRDGKPR